MESVLRSGADGQSFFCKPLPEDAGVCRVACAPFVGAWGAGGQEEERRGECERAVGAGFEAGALEGPAAVSIVIAAAPSDRAGGLWTAGLHGGTAQRCGTMGVQPGFPDAASGVSGVLRNGKGQAEQQQCRQDLCQVLAQRPPRQEFPRGFPTRLCAVVLLRGHGGESCAVYAFSWRALVSIWRSGFSVVILSCPSGMFSVQGSRRAAGAAQRMALPRIFWTFASW